MAFVIVAALSDGSKDTFPQCNRSYLTSEEGCDLNGFTETHVIAQDPTGVAQMETPQPLQALALIGVQLAV